MGKTSIFTRQPSSRKSSNDQPVQKEKNRSESLEKRKIRESKNSAVPSDDRLSRRKQSERPSKQLAENKNSLKRRKKHETVKTMAQNIPKDYVKDTQDNFQKENVKPSKDAAPEPESEAESIYESRKLLIRQIQGQIAKQVHEGRDSVSEYDSWSDLEDNFALAYEPIPLSIKMETWRKMTKREILRKVNSKKIRKDFEYLSHHEILSQIEKMQSNARYLSSKFGINHLMPHLDHVTAEVHHHQATVLDETEVEQSDGEISQASFVSGKEIYLSRAEILNKIHKAKGEKSASVTPPRNQAGANIVGATQNGKLSPKRNGRSGHDSWSSRASSILKDPEAIYVSRVELLKKINVLEDTNVKTKKPTREKGRNSLTPKAVKKESKPREHDSWSSRASSILAAIEAEETALQDEEPVYISRVELLKHLQMKSLEALSAASDKSGESDSDASTVKNSNSSQVGQQRKWKSQKLQFEKDMLEAIRDKQSEHGSNKGAEAADSNNNVGSEDDWDSCSCLTCHTCHLSDCSCSDISLSSQASKSSHSSDGSVETIIDAQERVVKHSDIYIVNGSDVSKASSKASSKMTKKSSNYDPLPLNGIEKIKQRKLTEEEIEIERRQEKEDNIRRSSVNERPSREKNTRGKSKDVKGSMKSQSSWTNEEFAKLYEPVSADDLKKQKQMRDLRQQLKNWTPELGKTVEHINTARRKEVIQKLKNVVAKNLDLDNLSEEELGKHLDIALSNLKMGAMYVPMEKNPSNSKTVSRENTDYDTFGSIDSLIFEPKIPTHEDIEEAQEEITQSFEYLENEDDGHLEMEMSEGQVTKMNILEKVSKFERTSSQVEKRSSKHEKNALAVGQTSFAERVKLFQSLGDKKNVTSAVTTQDEVPRETQMGSAGGSRRRDSPMNDSASHNRENSFLSQTTWKEQALNKKVERSGRDSVTSQSTNSSGSTVIYNINGTENDVDIEVKKSSYQRRGSFLESRKSNSEVKSSEVCSVCGECKSIISEWSCSCGTDCSECGGDTETREREESVYNIRDNQIPVVGNLRRANRAMNIEKTQEKKGFIAEDEEDSSQRTPTKENGTKLPLKIKQRFDRTDSFHQRQKRNQFRSFSPETKVDDGEQKNSYVNYKKSGLLVEVENGLPLIYKNEHLTEINDSNSSKCLDSPKSKGSEMGDSGISSDPSSISPKSSSSGSSADQTKTVEPEGEKGGEMINKLVPPGGKKRDTMIRELKCKLKERFPANTIEDKSRRQTLARSGNTIRSAEVGPKLTKIFDALLSESKSKSPAPSLLQAQYRNGSFCQDDDNLETVGEVVTSDTECDSSVYDPSLPPGLEAPLVTGVRSPPPGPPPTAQSKRGSVTSGSYQVSPDSEQARLSPSERREVLYGPGGMFGPRGPFSTPEISRYPEVPATKRISFADLADGRSEEDRSDKSQYVSNTVITGQRSSPTRLENYRVSPVSRNKEQQETGVAWQHEKQKRMINWINKSQVALGARVVGGGGGKNDK